MAAWYTYTDPFTWNYGAYPDPDGNFPKSDLNFGTPDGVPITALASGTVSGVNTPGAPNAAPAWGPVVTIKLDQPLNSQAQYMAYLHLGSVSVSEGQHVNVGDTLGVAGADAMGEHTRIGLALQSGPFYGFGSGFANPGSAALDPTTFLQGILAGKPITPNTATFGFPTLPGLPGAPTLGSLLPQGLLDWIGNPARIAKMVMGMALVGIALFLLLSSDPQVQQIAGTVAKVAAL